MVIVDYVIQGPRLCSRDPEVEVPPTQLSIKTSRHILTVSNEQLKLNLQTRADVTVTSLPAALMWWQKNV